MRFGDELILRGTNERVILITVEDGDAGTLRVGSPTRPAFVVSADDVVPVNPSKGCGCH